MFVGHTALALAGKTRAPRRSLGTDGHRVPCVAERP
jgi:hypothetical protein